MENSRHHVGRHSFLAVPFERVEFESVAAQRHNRNLDSLAQSRVLDTESNDVTYEVAGRYRLLDFSRADTETAAFDHRVQSTDKPEIPVLVDPHEVSAVDDLLFAEDCFQMRAHADLVGRRHGVTPVTLTNEAAIRPAHRARKYPWRDRQRISRRSGWPGR